MGRFRTRVRRALASAAVAAVALTGIVFGVAPAHAAGFGPGYGTQDDSIGWMGAYAIPGTGTLVFCIEPGISTPTGNTSFAGNVGVGFVSHSQSGQSHTPTADELARINAIIGTYGVGAISNRQASAVHFAVQYLGNPQGMFASGGYNNRDSDLRGFINWKLNSTVGSGEVGEIYALTQSILDATAGITAGGGTSNVTGSLVFAVDADNHYAGTVTPIFTGGDVNAGTITLTNGIFTSTGTSTISGATAGVALPIEGVPPFGADGYADEYKISGTGTFETGGSGWAAELALYETGSQQRTVASTGGGAAVDVTVSGEDPMKRGVGFSPVVTTVAPEFVQEGESFTDTLTAATAAGVWQANSAGVPAPVVAKGALYGPFSSRPDEAASAPASAPVAATAEVTLSGEGEYTATAGESQEAGYYTWQWSINGSDQIAGVQRLIGADYAWKDRFAQVIETSVTPNGFSAVSKVTASETGLGASLTDTLTIGLPDNGAWIRGSDGSRIPVTFRGTAYFVPGDEAPEVSDTVPADAQAIGTTTLVVTEPGVYTSDAIVAPLADGWVTWVWDIRAADQPAEYQGYVKEWSDQFGLPDETTRILSPAVSTTAQPSAKLGGEIFDTALVTGRIPEQPTTLSFEAFLVPMVKDAETGEWAIDAPEGTEDGDLTWVCESDPVFTSAETIVVTEAGEYVSEAFTPTEHGKYLWQESLIVTPEGGAPTVAHRGECGVEIETSFVLDVTTKAQTDDGNQTVDLGEMAFDRAILNGYIPEGATVTIVGYQTSTDTPVTEACTAETQVFEWTSEPLLGGMAENLEVDSDKFAPEHFTSDQTLYFVETSHDALGRMVSEGECGEPSETLTVEAGGGVLVWTGGSETPALFVGGSALMALFGASALYVARRRATA